jgi:hypothetical protein
MVVDVMLPGDSAMARVSPLSEHMKVIVADVSTANPLFALRRTTSRAEGKHVIVITDKDTPIPSHLSGISLHVIYRPEIGSGQYEASIESLNSPLAEIASDLQPTSESEPQRLLQQHDYHAAMIVACASLEHQLRKLQTQTDPNLGLLRDSLGRLLDPANEGVRRRE